MPADQLRHHDPGLVIVTFGEVIASGYAADEFCTVELLEDEVTETAGEDGSVVRSANRKRLGQVTLRLFHLSPTNSLLQAIRDADRASFGAGVKPLTVAQGAKTWTMPQAWIVRAPNVPLGAEAPVREWVFRGSPLQFIEGTAT